MSENSYKVSETTQRTLVALQQNGYIIPASGRLSDRIDAAVELLRLIVDASDGALVRRQKVKSIRVLGAECAFCGRTRGLHDISCVFYEEAP